MLIVRQKINDWFTKEAENIQLMTNLNEVAESEQTQLFHHEIHKKKLIKSTILELKTETDNCIGHKNCMDAIVKSVYDLLGSSFEFSR